MFSPLPWYVLLLPLISAAAILLVTSRWSGISSFVSVAAAVIGFVCSCVIFASPATSALQFTWIDLRPLLYIPLGLILDDLSKTMLVLVTGVGALIHIYSLGYMRHDASKSRYFASLSLFMFAMLGIVLANNFVMMFIFWELVGVSSYLLIGHWFERNSAAEAAKKAFLTNRIGDFGFMIGILMVWNSTGSVVFSDIATNLGALTSHPVYLTAAALLIFCGAVGKSAQFPLHVWLPDAMEGPTPISALIHAATMVAAGVYMLVRVGFLVQAAPQALTVIAWIGTITAVMAALIATQQNDIKRILAYSTLSQLGYMTVALGASAYSAAVFHLMTHAFFKALLFLGAGSVIIGMHHVQDIRQMGGLRKYMPITWITSLVGSLALIGTPFFSGFYSKDSIIEAVHESHLPGAGFAYFAVAAGVFVTAFYSFRMYFLVFHGEERFGKAHTSHEGHDLHDDHHAHDDDHSHDEEHHGLAPGEKPGKAPWVVKWPLILLAIPSVLIGYFTIGPMLHGDFFKGVIFVSESHHAMEELTKEFHGAWDMGLHSFTSLPFILALSGVVAAYYCYLVNPKVPAWFYKNFQILYKLLDNKYYMDKFNELVFAGGARRLGNGLWGFGDKTLIDGLLVNGSAKLVGWFSVITRAFQTGYIYHYAFTMILGIALYLGYLLLLPYLK